MITETQIQAEMALTGCAYMQARNNLLARKIVTDRERRNWNRRTRWVHLTQDRRTGDRRNNR